MFSELIKGFRHRNTDRVIPVGPEADTLNSYRVCSEFVDTHIHDDDPDIYALCDYIEYGDDGLVNARLLDRLAAECNRFVGQMLAS